MNQDAQLIDHPPQAAISLSPCVQSPAKVDEKTFGGLRCQWCIPHRPGTRLNVTVSALHQRTSALAIVTRCELDDEGYRIELRFLDPQQAFAIRMMEQLCHIQYYRSQIRQLEGRELAGDEAAREWIGLFAKQFPAA